MTQPAADLRQLFSLRVDDELSPEQGQELSQTLQSDPDLADDFADFAQVVQLLNALPRPPEDPDFALKVQRRIARRQRVRRRVRRNSSSLPQGVGAISTLVTLCTVLTVAVLTHPMGLQVSKPVASTAASTQARLQVDVTPATGSDTDQALRRSLEQLKNHGLILQWQVQEQGITLHLHNSQLAIVLDKLAEMGTLHISHSKNTEPQPMAKGLSFFLQIR